MSIKPIEGGLCAAQGFKVGSLHCGIRQSQRDDLTLVVSDQLASAAGCFTTNSVQAWCVQHNRERLKHGRAKALICLAGNANACNGLRGKEADSELSRKLALILGCAADQVLTASTGVIGRPLDFSKLEKGLPQVHQRLGTDNGKAAAAIMTTDLVPKTFAVEASCGATHFRIGGIAKGSGMIAPNMATMLAFISTDARIAPGALQVALQQATEKTFNRISVDGDTSTNDMVLVLANGMSDFDAEQNPALFNEALQEVCLQLAKMVARDGEGATKLIEVRVSGRPAGADRLAKTIAESPLVKTACFGNDPNWGRILAAAGRSGVQFDPNSVSISIGSIEVFRAGEPTNFDAAQVSAAMKAKDLLIEFRFLEKPGAGEPVSVWTCDFSYDYVKINADYTT